MTARRMCALLMVLVLLSSFGCGSGQPSVTVSEPDPWEMTTAQVVRDMGIGIDLGNTYEAFGDWVDRWGDGSVESYVTCWGSPVITREIIQGYADEGFGVLRIPVHWFNLMGDDYTISPEYMASVKQTVDWTLDSGMYAIVNIHHDEDGFFASVPQKRAVIQEAYAKIWAQIAEAFRDYDHRLVLESMNEEGCWDSVWDRWGGTEGKARAYGLLYHMNQTFVDTVRASGGNNARRHLLIAGYATDITATCDPMFRMPEDPAGRCAVSVHYYTPPAFALLEEDASWGKAAYTWGTEEEYEELERLMDMMRYTFADEGIPVILGEYGCPINNKDPESVRRYLVAVCRTAYERGICPILWDIPGGRYDRVECRFTDRQLLEEMMPPFS